MLFSPVFVFLPFADRCAHSKMDSVFDCQPVGYPYGAYELGSAHREHTVRRKYITDNLAGLKARIYILVLF